MELRNLWSSLFGSGRTDIRKEPIKIDAEPKADSYYQLKKHLRDDYGIELVITSRTSKKKEDGE